MTTISKDEIVKMAREAGFIIGRSVTTGEPNSPERFAHLCRADLVAEIERLNGELEIKSAWLREVLTIFYHDGVPTNPKHPKRITVNKIEKALK